MAEIGTATVKVTPVIDEDALAQVDTAVREAVADALRKVADSLVAKPTGKVVDPRYQAIHLDGQWGVSDSRSLDEWAAFDPDDPDARRDAEESAASLSRGDEYRSAYFWTPRPTA